MIFGSTRKKIRKYKLKKIRRGWHDWFAWYPVRLEDGGMAWLHEIERKYYQKSPRSVVKRGLNESKADAYRSLSVMHRRKGSDAEKRVYHRRNGSPYVDPNEIFKNMSDDEKDRILGS
jgi:hypothetical protein